MESGLGSCGLDHQRKSLGLYFEQRSARQQDCVERSLCGRVGALRGGGAALGFGDDVLVKGGRAFGGVMPVDVVLRSLRLKLTQQVSLAIFGSSRLLSGRSELGVLTFGSKEGQVDGELHSNQIWVSGPMADVALDRKVRLVRLLGECNVLLTDLDLCLQSRHCGVLS